jgi:citrate synthase
VREWDSVNHISMMLALEEAFGISIADDELVELSTVAAIRQCLAVNGVSVNDVSVNDVSVHDGSPAAGG